VAETRSYLVMPIDPDISTGEVERVFGAIARAVPGLCGPPEIAAMIKKDGAAVLNIPSASVDVVKDILGNRFLLDSNAPLSLLKPGQL
jgi:hypothetical protein